MNYYDTQNASNLKHISEQLSIANMIDIYKELLRLGEIDEAEYKTLLRKMLTRV